MTDMFDTLQIYLVGHDNNNYFNNYSPLTLLQDKSAEREKYNICGTYW